MDTKTMEAIASSSATAYETLIEAEKTAHTIEIREILTGKEGVANTCKYGIAVFYGADDGSDDTIISPEEFNQRFEITAIIDKRRQNIKH